MPKFELVRLDSVIGKQDFYHLKVDGVSQYETFSEEIKGNPQYVSEHKTILAYMNMVSSLKMLPKEKFRELKGNNDNIKEYEIKSKHLRAYLFHVEHTGKLVAYWGHKNTQDSDITTFRLIKKTYFKSLS
ncbi:hypothetical protein OQZ33_24065 [Pedobacter sp. MC2016-05]|uniref:hypothetical protein n=1 Tax=Pedobacter sp. MC2016-05 TaxID=2994474 RepID=UPI0022465200|nr:hypothetical protein [Pedobacter sp. MC2016-05]MCX2477426.1 hypothetical protein [Pedobacter sp. MC2016-05]